MGLSPCLPGVRLVCKSVVSIFGDLDELTHVNLMPLQNLAQISSDFMGLPFPNIKNMTNHTHSPNQITRIPLLKHFFVLSSSAPMMPI